MNANKPFLPAREARLASNWWLRYGLRSPEALPHFAFVTILGACLFVAVLLIIDAETDWNEVTLHGLTAIALLAISTTAWITHRHLALSLSKREAERDHRAAIAANLARSRYLANISHEIRSPLNAIYGYAQLVERNEGVSPKEAARVIRRCAEHMTSLIDGLLDVSQLTNGVLRVKADVINPVYFLDQIVTMLRPSAAAKGLVFQYDQVGRLPEFVKVDQSRFRQVLINLLSNAIKFTDSGTVTLRLRYAGQIATFEIVDTGPGILPENRERIFDPYDRGGDTSVEDRPGSGLGLPITRAIVEILGGKIELESEPGKGSCFRVTMMMGEVAGQMAPAQLKRKVTGYAGARQSVLVVDDDPEQRHFLETLLASLGFDVIAVSNGETALSVSDLRGFELAVLDITLPGMSGWETAKGLRDRFDQDIRILMLSANAQEFHRPESDRPAHDYFLVKPVEFGALIEAIGGLLNLSWIWEVTDHAVEPVKVPISCGLGEAAQQHASKLRELLRIGHVRGIEAEIQNLAATGPQAEELARVLFDCLDRFDLAGISRALEAT